MSSKLMGGKRWVQADTPEPPELSCVVLEARAALFLCMVLCRISIARACFTMQGAVYRFCL